jgi:hypothetical protein
MKMYLLSIIFKPRIDNKGLKEMVGEMVNQTFMLLNKPVVEDCPSLFQTSTSLIPGMLSLNLGDSRCQSFCSYFDRNTKQDCRQQNRKADN